MFPLFPLPACLAMRREVFFEIGGFDETNTPISLSDIDLCFKVRETGRRCVYTPFASLTHHGHASIGRTEEESAETAPDKCSIFLLQRWAAFTCHDPYFTDRMREWLYADSPMPIQMFAGKNSETAAGKRDLLFVTHDLSLSGAPIILSHLAKWCKSARYFCDGDVTGRWSGPRDLRRGGYPGDRRFSRRHRI